MNTNDINANTDSSPISRPASNRASSSRRPPSDERGNPVTVSLVVLDQHPRPVRLANQEHVIAGLAAQMKIKGYFEKRFAITVRRKADGRFEVIAGWHRVEAARLAGLNEVWAFPIETTEGETHLALGLSNTQESMGTSEVGLFGQQIVEEDKTESIASLARKLGMKRENLSRYMKGARVYTSVRALLSADEIIRCRDKAEHLARVADAPKDKWAGIIKQFIAAEAEDPTLCWTIKATEAVVEALTAAPSGLTPLDPTDGPSVGPPDSGTSHDDDKKSSNCTKTDGAKSIQKSVSGHGKKSAHGTEEVVEVSLTIGADEPTKLPVDGKLVRVRVTRIEIPREVLERALKESASDGSSEFNGIATVSVDAHLLHRIPTVTSGTVKMEVL